jgi:glycosyltransferase involved in cell wall biosynthesis
MSADTPHITAMMLVRDRAQLLEPAAHSVLEQTDGDLELLIVDDGSRDSTPEVAARIAASDPRVRVLTNAESVGIPAARNQALAAARGEFLAICDSDDLSRPDRFARQRQRLDSDPALVAVGCRINAFSDDPASGSEPAWHWGLRDGRPEFAFPGTMLRTEAVRAAGGFDERYRVAEDLHLTYRLAGRGGRFATVDAVLVDYRIHAGSVTQRRAASLQWWTLRAQLRGLVELRGRVSARGYAVLVQTVLRWIAATARAPLSGG